MKTENIYYKKKDMVHVLSIKTSFTLIIACHFRTDNQINNKIHEKNINAHN